GRELMLNDGLHIRSVMGPLCRLNSRSQRQFDLVSFNRNYVYARHNGSLCYRDRMGEGCDKQKSVALCSGSCDDRRLTRFKHELKFAFCEVDTVPLQHVCFWHSGEVWPGHHVASVQ